MALPTPTPAAAITGYIATGRRKIVWVATMAAYATPTTAEITAGTDLSPWIIPDSVTGFSTTSEFVDDPRLSTRTVNKVAGVVTFEDSSIRFVAGVSAADVRALLTRDLTGYIVICWEGIVTSGKCSVFPVTIGSASEETGDGSALSGIMVTFAITGTPAEQIAIPTA